MFGTDLHSAFGGPYDNMNQQDSMSSYMMVDTPQQPEKSEIVHKSTPLTHLANNQQQINLNQLQQQQQAKPLTQPQFHHPQPSNNFPLTQPNDPRIGLLLNELQKQQQITASMQDKSGYLDRLFSKKKDLLKVIQLALVIVLALSIHFIIDYYLRNYIKNNDLSFERELIIRLLYPFALIFVLWHMKAFVK